MTTLKLRATLRAFCCKHLTIFYPHHLLPTLPFLSSYSEGQAAEQQYWSVGRSVCLSVCHVSVSLSPLLYDLGYPRTCSLPASAS